MSRKTKQPSINHINLLNAIKARSGVEVCHASNETLAKDLGVSLSTVKRLLDDMQRPVEERTPPSKERKRVPLGLGSIEIITGRPFHQGGKMHQHREIYIIDRTSCDEKGAYMVAALAAKFGRTTKREDRYFCGQLQCTKGQFERWLELAQELDLVSVSVDETDGRRVITRIAKGVSEEVELPDTLRVAAPVEVDGKWKLVSSKSDWTPHLKRSIAERLRDLLRSQCAQQGGVPPPQWGWVRSPSKGRSSYWSGRRRGAGPRLSPGGAASRWPLSAWGPASGRGEPWSVQP